MGKIGDKSGGTVPTRRIKSDKTRQIQGGEEAAGAAVEKELNLDREQLRGQANIQNATPPTVAAGAAAGRGQPAAATEKAGAAAGKAGAAAGKKTQVYRPRKGDDAKAKPAAKSAPVESSKGGQSESDDPVVGWLVIVEGAGRGHSLNIGYGLNKIGREAGQEVALDFGDAEISRERHAAIEFDPKVREFFLSKGENLVYLNGKRVGQNSEESLSNGDQIEIGQTVLRFMAFCGPDFDWSE